MINAGNYLCLFSFVHNQDVRNRIPPDVGVLATDIRSGLVSIDTIGMFGEPTGTPNPLITVVEQEFSYPSKFETDIQAWIRVSGPTDERNIGEAVARAFFHAVQVYPDGSDDETAYGQMMVDCSRISTQTLLSTLALGLNDPSYTQVCLQVATSIPSRPTARTVSGSDRLFTSPIQASNQSSLVGQQINPVTIPGVQDIRDAASALTNGEGSVLGVSASDIKGIAWGVIAVVGLFGVVALVKALPK